MKNTPKRRGTVLIFVLIVVVVLSLAVLTFSKLMTSERRGATYSVRQKQSRLLAESGVEWLRLFLSQDQLTIEERGDIYDNIEFSGVLVTDGTTSGNQIAGGLSMSQSLNPMDVGRFYILAPKMSDDGSLIGEWTRFGLEDESAKINLHWIMQIEKEYPGMGRIILTRLPGVSDEVADAILDWMDDDDDAREYGAEYDYYEVLDPPYYPKNAVPDSIDDLLLVAGVTPQLLYGVDWNRNGMHDIGEPDSITLEDAFGVTDESLNLGLAAYLTVDSRESQLTPDGLYIKINVNTDDLEQLRTDLTERLGNEEWADYIVAYRQNGPSESQSDEAATETDIGGGNTSDGGGNTSGGQQQQQQPPSGGTTESGGTDAGLGVTGGMEGAASGGSGSSEIQNEIKSLLYLVGGSAGGIESPFSSDIGEMREYLPILYDNLTVKAEQMVGRINLNQAPRAVLEMFSTEFDDSDAAMEAMYSAMGIDPSMLESLLGGESEDSAASSLPTAGSLLEMLGIPMEEVDPLIQGILEMRIPDPAEAYQSDPDMMYPYWPYTLGITEDLETLKKIEPYFCTRGSVYRTQVVGKFDANSPVVRFEVWIDASLRPAQIIRIRELSELGPGYPPNVLGTDELYRY